MNRLFYSFFAAVILLSGGMMSSLTAEDQVTTKAHLVVDFQSGKILQERNSREVRQVASLTKVAAALVALEWLDKVLEGAGYNLPRENPVWWLTVDLEGLGASENNVAHLRASAIRSL